MAIDKRLDPYDDVPLTDRGGRVIDLDDLDDVDYEDATVTMLDDGGAEVSLEEDEVVAEDIPFDANLVDYLEKDELTRIATELSMDIKADIASRKEWVDTYIEGLDTIGLKYEERSEPWTDACGVYSTVLAEAVIRFQAEAMSETFPAQGPVKTKIVGEETREKSEAAERVRMDMNYEITEVMTEYRPEHERMLYSLAMAGSSFKKVYYDSNLQRQTAVYVPAEDVLVPYGASHINSAERVTHIMRKTKNEVAKLQLAGFYAPIDLGEPVRYTSDIEEKKAKNAGRSVIDDNRFCLYEVHVDFIIHGIDEDSVDVEGEGDDVVEIVVAKPYVITMEYGTNKILAIRRNWDPEDELKAKRQHFVHYVYVPGNGFYGLGLTHIIGGYARAGTSLMRQLVDAGTLSNLPGGLKTKGLRIKGDDTPISPGEWRDVDVPSGTITDNIMPLPYKEPSMVLLNLLGRITDEGRRLGAISDMNISDMSANAPVGTTLALLERTLKPMAAVQARVHFAMKQEFKLLRAIIAEYAPTEYGYDKSRGESRARQSDYAMVEVIPVSDPNSSTMAQRIVQYQSVEQLSKGAPQIYDLPYLHRQMIEVLGVPNADKIIPVSKEAKPQDPVSENMAALVGKPMKAHINQDHAAHMATHQAFMQDPMIAQTIGQNPMANQITGAMQAHIAEHLAFNYRKQMEEKIGAPLPAPGSELAEDIENTLSQVMAAAGIQLAQVHAQQAAQQEAQKQAEDPIIQMRKQELQIDAQDVKVKAAEVARKAQKDAYDKEIAEKKLKQGDNKIRVDATIEAEKLDVSTKHGGKKLKIDAAKILQPLISPKNNGDKNKR